MSEERIKYILSWVLWPALFIGCMSFTTYGFLNETQFYILTLPMFS